MLQKDNFLTDEDFITAAANGIDKANLRNRFYKLHMDKEKATTAPLGSLPTGRKKGIWYDYKDQAEKMGVSMRLFYYRIGRGKQDRKGMTPEQAVSFPPIKGGRKYNLNNG